MNRIHQASGMLLALVLAGAAQGAVTLTEWGTLGTIASGTCASDYCGDNADTSFPLTLSVDPIDGGVGQTSASVATGTWPDPGSASGSATVTGGLGVPILKAGAASQTEQWLAGQALAVQAYEYTGAGETLSLTWNLEGTVTNPDADTLTGLVVLAGFFDSADLPTFPDPDVLGASGTFYLLATLGTADPADNYLEYTASGAHSESGTVDIDVLNGDQFYLVMGLMAGAGGSGALAESLSTLTASFDGDPALTPAFTAVPVPGAAWLLGGGLIGLLGVGGRRRRGPTVT